MHILSLRSFALSLCLAAAVGAALAQARPSPPGEGNYPPPAVGESAWGPGGGMGPEHGRWRAGPHHTPGWSMMSEQERAQHHAQLRAARNAEECQRIMGEHQRLMQQRATERGMPLQRPPRAACPAR